MTTQIIPAVYTCKWLPAVPPAGLEASARTQCDRASSVAIQLAIRILNRTLYDSRTSRDVQSSSCDIAM
eukprot:UN3167